MTSAITNFIQGRRRVEQGSAIIPKVTKDGMWERVGNSSYPTPQQRLLDCQEEMAGLLVLTDKVEDLVEHGGPIRDALLGDHITGLQQTNFESAVKNTGRSMSVAGEIFGDESLAAQEVSWGPGGTNNVAANNPVKEAFYVSQVGRRPDGKREIVHQQELPYTSRKGPDPAALLLVVIAGGIPL